jgi:hypothetical protein
MNSCVTADQHLDRGLDVLAAYGPFLANRFTNHAPMVIEALHAMGCAHRIEPWIDAYRAQLRPWPPDDSEIETADWRAALGRQTLASAWRRYFRRELQADGWAEVLRRWVPRLAPGAISAALHGLIRVAHSARSLTQRESPARVSELADALASWACTYRELPAVRGASHDLSPREALSCISFVPLVERKNEGSITAAVTVLQGRERFESAIDMPALDGDLTRINRTFGELFGSVFVANVRDALTAIVFTHGVTGFGAVEILLPLLSRHDGEELIRRVWAASAALYACYGISPPAEPGATSPAQSSSELVEAAVAHGDDHVIKLTEACLRFVANGGTRELLRAPVLAMSLLPRGGVSP